MRELLAHPVERGPALGHLGLQPRPLGQHVVELVVERVGVAREVLARSAWLESKVSEGGTALVRVREQLEQARARL